MKIKLDVTLQRDNGSQVTSLISKTAPTKTEALALVQAEIDNRLATATTALQELSDANVAFNQ